MCIFQSEQVIKLRFWHKKQPRWYLSLIHNFTLWTKGHSERQLLRHHGTLSEIRAKTDQHCPAEDCLAIDIEWFARGVHW